MASLLLDTETFLTFLRRPDWLTRQASERLKEVAPEQIFISIVTLHAVRQRNRAGTVSDKQFLALCRRLRPGQVLEVDFETRLLADYYSEGALEARLIAATARRWRLVLLAATLSVYSHYQVDLIASVKADSESDGGK